MLAAPDLDVLWVVGANPLKDASLAAASAFVVVQDLFLTETARRADIVLPAASAYEKSGHGHQRLRRGAEADAEPLPRWGQAGSGDLPVAGARNGTRDRGRRARSRTRCDRACRCGTAAGPDPFGRRYTLHLRHAGALFEGAG